MNNLKQHFTNEQTGVSYTLVGDYYLPDLTLPEKKQYDVGRFGLMRRHYLKEHRKGLFAALLTSGKLNEHLYEIDHTAKPVHGVSFTTDGKIRERDRAAQSGKPNAVDSKND